MKTLIRIAIQVIIVLFAVGIIYIIFVKLMDTRYPLFENYILLPFILIAGIFLHQQQKKK